MRQNGTGAGKKKTKNGWDKRREGTNGGGMRQMVKTTEEPVVAGTQSRMKNHIMATHTHTQLI